jgi:ketosteroid isomerase-like protein
VTRNVDVVRHSLGALARGDFDAAFSAVDPEAEWRTAADEPDRQTYSGLPGLRRFADRLAEPWVDRFADVMRFEDFIESGDWVIAPWTAEVTGRGSGAKVEIRETWAVLVQAGRIVRVEEYRTKERALEAVGSR